MEMRACPIVVVGTSAGGVEALRVLVQGLPADIGFAMFIVMHVPAHTPSGLADILRRVTALPVRVPDDGEPIRRGHLYVARADHHLLVEAERIRLSRGPKECRARPAIDALFRSAAIAHGPRVIGVVLTGTLDDGTAGLWTVKDRGGVALVQDPATAEFASMPESARQHVEVDGVLPLDALAAEIVRRADRLGSRAVPPVESKSMQVENVIAMEGNGLQAGVMELGKVSRYTCPDCHGVLVQIEEGSIVRFRCHTGHAFSLLTLLAEIGEAIDKGLWDALRAVEERIMLLSQMAELSSEAGLTALSARCRRQADDAQERVQPLRELVLDPKLFGYTPDGQRS